MKREACTSTELPSYPVRSTLGARRINVAGAVGLLVLSTAGCTRNNQQILVPQEGYHSLNFGYKDITYRLELTVLPLPGTSPSLDEAALLEAADKALSKHTFLELQDPLQASILEKEIKEALPMVNDHSFVLDVHYLVPLPTQPDPVKPRTRTAGTAPGGRVRH